MLHLATLVQGCWLTVSLFPGKPFLGQVPSLEGPFWSLLWPHKVVWPDLNVQVSKCDRILQLLGFLRPLVWSLAERWSRQPASSPVPGHIVPLR
jgi:hypothetical protein